MKRTGYGLKLSAGSKKALVQDLLECAMICEQCATGCLKDENAIVLAKCISFCRDSASACFQAARLVVKGSMATLDALAACEKICRLCGDECNQHNSGHCRSCACACERCAQTCHQRINMLRISWKYYIGFNPAFGEVIS